jgi:hypothetical protein
LDGFHTRVTLDGIHTFCVPESLKPGTGSGGSGLCNEFGIDLPVGYAEIEPVNLFPKLGIGLLRKPDHKPYDFSRPYEVAQPFEFRVQAGPDWVRISSQPADCNGYAVLLSKQICLEGNCLVIRYQLENTGLKPILTQEYAHNFVAIDNQPIGPGYQLSFADPISLNPAACVGLDSLRITGNQVGFAEDLEGLYLRPQAFSKTNQAQWELLLPSKGVGLREFDDFTPCRIAVWGTLHVLSPEIFVAIILPAGQVLEWTRRYEFFD